MSQNFLSYTSRDFNSIKEDLVNAIPSLTNIWTNREEADPGMVLITLMSALGDNLSFNMDQQSLEFFGQTVTQRKNASRVLDLIGYKLHWYKSAKLEVTIRNNHNLNKLYLVFNPASSASTQKIHSMSIPNAPSYILLNPTENISTWNKNTTIEIPAGGAKTFNAIQGSISSVGFDASAIDINNRYYLPVSKIDQEHLWLADSAGIQWYITDNINELTETEPRFQFGVDEYNLPYIEFVPYWETSFGSSHSFTLYYVVTRGSSGNVAANVLDTITGLVSNSLNTGRIKRSDITITHGSNTLPNNRLTNVPGKEPQSAKDAYWDSRNYIGTYNTLVTLLDFEKFMLRQDLISAAKAVDGQFAKEYNETLSEDQAANKIYPLAYNVNSYKLYDGTNYIDVLPDKSVTSVYSSSAQQLLELSLDNSDINTVWFKADKHNYGENKHVEIVASGNKDIGALQFVHNGTGGDLKIGLIPPQGHEVSSGVNEIRYYLKFENILPELSDPNFEDNLSRNIKNITDKLKNLSLIFEEEDYESDSIDLLSALYSDNGDTSLDAILNSFATRASGTTSGFTDVLSVSQNIKIHEGRRFTLRLHCDVAGDVSDAKISLLLDNLSLVDTAKSDNITGLPIDELYGVGNFCTAQVPITVYKAVINGDTYYFDVNSDDSIARISKNLADWTLVDNDVVTIVQKDTITQEEFSKTYLFQAASEDFAPYSLQMHMVAGDFLTFNPEQITYKYADETPVIVETTNSGENRGYINYQLSDTIVGADSDSLISQTNLDAIKVFNTELSYGPVRKFPFYVDGKIHLKSPVRPAEANLILSKVYANLRTYFNAFNLTMGEKIVHNDIINVIRSSDPNIDYFDAGANNSHGALIIYPTAENYDPHKYNESTRQYGKYDLTIDPKYFNILSMQHYEDMLQANNSIVYWGDTLSKHLSIAEESLSEKSIPLTAGINAFISYDNDTAIVSVSPDVANLYEYNIFKNVMVDSEYKLVTNIPDKVKVKCVTQFEVTNLDDPITEYKAIIPKEQGDTISGDNDAEHIGKFIDNSIMFQLLDENDKLITICYNASQEDYVSLEVGFFKAPFDINDMGTYIEISPSEDAPTFKNLQSTQIFYLREYVPLTATSYSLVSDDADEDISWPTDNKISNISTLPKTIYYEALTAYDHIWGRTEDSYIQDPVVYERYSDGYAAAVRAKETITSQTSSIIVSSYASLPKSSI